MSLINDALKRASLAQKHHAAASPPPSHALLPAQRAPAPGWNVRRLLLAAFILALATTPVWLWWQGRSDQPKTPLGAAPRPSPPAPPRAAQRPPASPPQPPPMMAKPVPATSTNATPVAASVPLPAPQPTNSPAVAAPPATLLVEPEPPGPEPASLRLQAIVCHPTRPWVMISGRTLFIGDRLGGLRLVAIDRQSATLIGHGRTNVLSLP